jgi:pyruvate-ferredoxin/flavodoxin oxidoreductase
MSYPAYVARVAMGSSDAQTLKAFNEAEAYDGPSLILAYSHCVAHGYDLVHGLDQQKLAVQSGHWPLFRYNPDVAPGQANFVLDSAAPSIPLEQYIYNETRYTMLRQHDPESAKELLGLAQRDVVERWKGYEARAQQSAAAAEAAKATAVKGGK